MTWIEPTKLAVPVDGGALTVARWGSGSRVVVASHGITANHRAFGEVAAQLRDADVSLYAVDHRGRGGSAGLPGPYGVTAHARDLMAVLDHLEVEAAVFVGHSMGAFVVASAAASVPERVSGLVLVDGALPVPVDLPPDADIEAVVRSVIGPALDRLERTFASPEDYVALWREHPAVGGRYFTDVAEAYVRYDLVADGAVWRSPVDKGAVLEDGRSLLVDDEARTAITRVEVPTTLLWAPRGLLDQAPGLYPPELVDDIVADLPHVDARRVADVNHYSILFSEVGGAAVAERIVERLS